MCKSRTVASVFPVTSNDSHSSATIRDESPASDKGGHSSEAAELEFVVEDMIVAKNGSSSLCPVSCVLERCCVVSQQTPE